MRKSATCLALVMFASAGLFFSGHAGCHEDSPLAVPCCGAEEQAPEEKKEEGRGLGYIPLDPAVRAAFHRVQAPKHGGRLRMLAKFESLPAAFDARDKGWVLPVGNQGSCGSCYLYSTVYGTMTSAFVRAGYGKADGSLVMSVQFGMDCHNFGGCNGGNGTQVIDWACKNGWPAERWTDVDGTVHNDYPGYSARSLSCRKVPGAKLWKPADWSFVSASPNRPATTLEIKTALVNFGPLNVSLDAGGQFGNGTGTITSLGSRINHEIELVAYDDNKDGGAFLLKNQWDKTWGNGGYRWCTYQAAQHLVDIFYVMVALLPPVPPDPVPPVPPGPTPPVPPVPPDPNGLPTVTTQNTGSAYDGIAMELVPPGVTHAIAAAAGLLQAQRPPTPTLPLETRVDKLEANVAEILRIVKGTTAASPRVDVLENAMIRLSDSVLKLQTEIMGKDKQK